MYNALTLRQSAYNGNSYFKNVQITIISHIIVDLLMGFYGFHLHSWLLLQIKIETRQQLFFYVFHTVVLRLSLLEPSNTTINRSQVIGCPL